MTTLSVLDEVTWAGSPVAGERTRALLRALVDAGPRGASESTLVEEIWGLDDVPANPAKALQVVVSRARTATDAGAIERTPRGYRLRLDPAQVDAWSLRPEGLRLAAEKRYAEALPLLERLDHLDPDEEVTEALLRTIAAVHGPPAALERYETYRNGLADGLGVDPSPRLRAVHAELLARDRPVRSGLRHDADVLIGREQDAAEVSAMLKSSRVVTILGPGGLGKTSLAQVIAHRAEQPVVHFVELVGVTAPEDLVSEVGSALGVRDSVARRDRLTPEQRADVRSRIAQQLDGTPTLLVLDNCEHIVAAVADLAAFLAASVRHLTILTTSRSPLAIGAERVFPLGRLGTYDGSELFRRRAVAARPTAHLDATRVEEIVTRLDGLPLAIELAAVKVRAMSVDEIGRRLENRFELLRGGDRNAPDRHQTLVAVIDWSWNLLSEREQRAMRWLSVFHDGFTLAAAEAVLGTDALDTIEELVDQSLLTVVESPLGLRYRMLETVREFGRMRLIDAGEDAAARAAQRAWAGAYADSAAARIYSREQFEAMDTLRAEESNLADILRQVLADDEAETAIRLFCALGVFWTVAGEHQRVIMLAGPVGDLLEEWEPPGELLEKTRLVLALLLFGAAVTGGAGLPRLTAVLERVGADAKDTQLRVMLRVMQAMARAATGRGVGRSMADELAELIADPDPEVRARAYTFLSHERENLGDPEGAVAAGIEALRLTGADGGPWPRAMLHAQLSGLFAQLGRLREAADHAREAIPVLRRLGADDDLGQAQAILATYAVGQGRFEEAAAILAEVGDEQLGGGFGARGAIHAARAQLLLAQGRVPEGLAVLREVAASMGELPFPGFADDLDLVPWRVAAESVAVVSAARHGDGAEGEDLFAALMAKAPRMVADDRRSQDYPVAGMLLFALGMWGLHREMLPSEDSVRLLVLGDRFGYSRSFLDLRWELAVEDAERLAPGVLDRIEQEYGERRGLALLDEARGVIARVTGTGQSFLL
ncbi:putative ATPase [Nocardioides luteus]|uniref:ATP-binding protein n=1 Tax=Nocardioides luteus TaxID=1844 RepID=UPI0019AEC55B|nr:BTAD domain-containing putative transcriptional regulator [Nocardioides luteus]MDR7310427.1 putative ATPase [Nocardioides luteus]GGR52790.1 SARP family transcriptional regulator [Nocardioides luteus]